MVKVKSHISAITAYSPPWTGLDRSQYTRLDLNENTQAPPDHVREALAQYVSGSGLQMYPNYSKFMSALSSYTGADENQLLISNGSDQAIEIILRAFLSSGDSLLIAQPEFPIFSQVTKVIGAKVIGVPYCAEDLAFPYAAFREAIVAEKPQLIVLINPNNPTGTAIELSFIESILKENPDTPVIVDEAYFEFLGLTAQALMSEYANLIIVRTFSKAFAMAGLRLGYIIAAPELIHEFNKVRGPFDINSCALIAAEAQIKQPHAWQAYVSSVMQTNKLDVESFLRESHEVFYPGSANFMLVKPKHRDNAVNWLKDHGILVRPMLAPGITDTFRLSVGTAEETHKFIQTYASYLKQC